MIVVLLLASYAAMLAAMMLATITMYSMSDTDRSNVDVRAIIDF